MARGGVRRLVGSRRAEPHEEGTVGREERRGAAPRTSDVAGRPLCKHIVQMVVFGVVADDAAVLVEVGAHVVARDRVPLVPAGGHVGPFVAVHVLADEDSPVVLGLEPGRYCRLLAARGAELLEAALWWLVAEDLVVVSVLAAQDRRPRRAAQRVRHEGVLEGGTTLDEQGLEVRHVGDRTGIQVVGEDHDHVRAIRRLGVRLRVGADQSAGLCELPLAHRRTAPGQQACG